MDNVHENLYCDFKFKEMMINIVNQPQGENCLKKVKWPLYCCTWFLYLVCFPLSVVFSPSLASFIPHFLLCRDWLSFVFSCNVALEHDPSSCLCSARPHYFITACHFSLLVTITFRVNAQCSDLYLACLLFSALFFMYLSFRPVYWGLMSVVLFL